MTTRFFYKKLSTTYWTSVSYIQEKNNIHPNNIEYFRLFSIKSVTHCLYINETTGLPVNPETRAYSKLIKVFADN